MGLHSNTRLASLALVRVGRGRVPQASPAAPRSLGFAAGSNLSTGSGPRLFCILFQTAAATSLVPAFGCSRCKMLWQRLFYGMVPEQFFQILSLGVRTAALLPALTHCGHDRMAGLLSRCPFGRDTFCPGGLCPAQHSLDILPSPGSPPKLPGSAPSCRIPGKLQGFSLLSLSDTALCVPTSSDSRLLGNFLFGLTG